MAHSGGVHNLFDQNYRVWPTFVWAEKYRTYRGAENGNRIRGLWKYFWNIFYFQIMRAVLRKKTYVSFYVWLWVQPISKLTQCDGVTVWECTVVNQYPAGSRPDKWKIRSSCLSHDISNLLSSVFVRVFADFFFPSAFPPSFKEVIEQSVPSPQRDVLTDSNLT